MTEVVRELPKLLGFVVLYVVAAEVSNFYSYEHGDLAVIWPASGVFLSALILAPYRLWWVYLLALGVTHLLEELSANSTVLPVSVGFTLSLMAEAALGAWFMKRQTAGGQSFESGSGALSLVLGCCIVIVSVTSVLPALLNAYYFDAGFVRSWLNWAVADAIGILVITPILLSQWHKRVSREYIEICAVILGIIGVVYMVFALNDSVQGRLPHYTYLLIPVLIYAAFRFEAAAVACIVFVAALSMLVADYILATDYPPSTQISSAIEVQAYLFVVLTVPLLLHSIVSERGKLLRAQADQLSRMDDQSQALLKLSKMTTITVPEPDEVFREAIKIAANTLNVGRVGLWRLDEEKSKLVGDYLYDRSLGAYSTGDVLLRSHYPSYFEAIIDGHIISAADARLDTRTSEFREGYLLPLGITAMLDTFVRIPDYYEGVLCCEEVGDAPRNWEADELNFASSVSEHLARLLTERLSLSIEKRQRETERQMARAEKAEALEQLTRGVAHDYNNVMSVIMGHAELLQLEAEGEQKTSLENIQQAAERGSELSKKLIQGAKQTTEIVQEDIANVREIVERVLQFLEPKIDSRIALGSKVASDYFVRLDSGDLQDALLNLCMNGVYAMRRKGGTLSIEISEANPEGMIRISVQDSGEGISSSIVDQIFQPYFTTKGEEGSGIGLAQVNELARSANGQMEVESFPGVGTRVSIVLPVIQ